MHKVQKICIFLNCMLQLMYIMCLSEGYPQKRSIKPKSGNILIGQDVSFEGYCLFAEPVENVPNFVKSLPVGEGRGRCRLQVVLAGLGLPGFQSKSGLHFFSNSSSIRPDNLSPRATMTSQSGGVTCSRHCIPSQKSKHIICQSYLVIYMFNLVSKPNNKWSLILDKSTQNQHSFENLQVAILNL